MDLYPKMWLKLTRVNKFKLFCCCQPNHRFPSVPLKRSIGIFAIWAGASRRFPDVAGCNCNMSAFPPQTLPHQVRCRRLVQPSSAPGTCHSAVQGCCCSALSQSPLTGCAGSGLSPGSIELCFNCLLYACNPSVTIASRLSSWHLFCLL